MISALAIISLIYLPFLVFYHHVRLLLVSGHSSTTVLPIIE